MTLSPERLAEWRAQPDRAAIRKWENRTYQAARTALGSQYRGELLVLRAAGHGKKAAVTMLARRHPAQFLAILDGIRKADPRPQAGEEQQRGEADERAA